MATQTLTTNGQDASKGSQVRIRLSSRSEDINLPEDTGPILVSTDLRRYQLSTLVNRLLTTTKPIPFEFLINGQFLRTSIDDFLTQNGISAETTLSVEYIRALIPPSHVASYQHDDWVSSVDVLSETSPAGRGQDSQHRILSGSYDGLLRVWDTSSNIKATSQSAANGGHINAVKAVKFISPSQVASAGLDRTVRIWNYTDSADPAKAASFTPTLELYGHTASVDRLAVHAPSQRLLSASADHTIGIWSSTKSSLPPAPPSLLPSSVPSSKRRKISAPSTNTPQRGPLAQLKSHTAPVSDVLFKPDDHTVAYSTSWDHSLKTWDLPTRTCIDTRSTAQSLFSCAAMQSVNLVAAGGSARHITLIDPRASATSIVAMTLRGHGNAVVSLAPSPTNGFVLASGSHDGSVRVWDVRSVRAGVGQGAGEGGMVGDAVFVLDREGKSEKKVVGGEGVKVFGVVWDETLGVVSCGEDKRVQINRDEIR